MEHAGEDLAGEDLATCAELEHYLQSAMAAEYGNFNTQAIPASVDILGFSCRHACHPNVLRRMHWPSA